MRKNISFVQASDRVAMRRFVALTPAACSVHQPLEKAVIIEQKTTPIGKKTHGSIKMRGASEIQQGSRMLFWRINFYIQPSAGMNAAS
jgi:hypothetical protein